jgi:hypothetical protein
MKAAKSIFSMFMSAFLGLAVPCISAPNQMAPDFTATDINGAVRSLSEFSGSVVLLEFWYTW